MSIQNLQNAPMIRILILGAKILLVSFFTSCETQTKNIHFSTLVKENTKIANHHYIDYCNEFVNIDIDDQEIITSFVGNYQRAVNISADKNEKYLSNIHLGDKSMSTDDLKVFLTQKISTYAKEDPERVVFERFLEIIERPEKMDSLFNQFSKKDAILYIVNQANNFHFTCINESHYSGQNRAFTMKLLKPLWKQGYRYLALEAFTSRDTILGKLKQPKYTTGYYFKETNLGNLVREAIAIGYKLIPYDVITDPRLDLRDRENMRNEAQAKNIYNRTFKKDSVGKVLIHSGHDHQIEYSSNDRYKTMGKSLRKISNQDILTINQNVMIEKNGKENDYYEYASNHLELKSPSVFINKENKKCLIDPVKYVGGIDIQVYHPITKLINGRPNWMKSDENNFYELPDEIIENYSKHVLEVRPVGEALISTPVDQFIIDDTKQLLLPKGTYAISIVNCEGYIKCTLTTTVD